MKKISATTTAIILFLLLANSSMAQEHQLVKLWQTDSVMKVPESVLYYPKQQMLFVSNIDGTEPWGKDGKGSIGKLGADGTIIAIEWITGLNAPKGMGLHKKKLYVADMEEVVVIDIKKGTIIQRIKVEGAQGLNDISIDKSGVVYVTDSRAKKLHRIENGTVTTHLENLKGPNGVLVNKNGLFIVDAGGLYKVQADKTLTKIVDGMEGGTDGIEQVNANDHIVSCWGGMVYYVKGDGTKQTLLDTREQKVNSADIGYNAKKRIVYVPTFWRNSVVAYELK